LLALILGIAWCVARGVAEGPYLSAHGVS
jgi:hypothetical protein